MRSLLLRLAALFLLILGLSEELDGVRLRACAMFASNQATNSHSQNWQLHVNTTVGHHHGPVVFYGPR